MTSKTLISVASERHRPAINQTVNLASLCRSNDPDARSYRRHGDACRALERGAAMVGLLRDIPLSYHRYGRHNSYRCNHQRYFQCDVAFIANGGMAIGIFLLIAYAARWIGFPGVAAALDMLMICLAMTMLISFCSIIFAASNLPFRDSVLAYADSLLLGFDRNVVVAWASQSRSAMRGATWIYNSLAVTPQLLVLMLLATQKRRLAWIVVTALAIAVTVACCTMPFVPALGTPPYAYHFIEVFNGVRDGSIRRLDGSVITGLVTFPSVHAADAVILAWGFNSFGRWGWPFVVLNILMIGSALLVGGHYLVDLLAGIVVAVASIWLASAMINRLHQLNV